LPSIHPFREAAFAGCLLSYAVDLADVARRGVVYIDKVLRGARPGGIPVENLSKYDLIVNVQTATAPGLTIRPSLLARADPIIE
jgi:putative tryptophan/tyrosine transport system substrate-binding protein